MHPNIDKLVELFTKFPGIGPRQARRFVYFLLARPSTYIDNLLSTIAELRKEVSQCELCFRFYTNRSAIDTNTCERCVNPNTEAASLLVVEKDVDLENILKAKTYSGHVFVLGSLLPILEEHPEQVIRIRELKKRIVELADLKEIILALSVSPDGDNTIEYLRDKVETDFPARTISVSVLGRGLSTGSELEYVDPDTIRHALDNRK